MENEVAKGGTYSSSLLAGHLDDKGIIHREYLVGEMMGDDEDILAGPGNSLIKFNRIIGNRLISLGDITDKNVLRSLVGNLCMLDRFELIIGIRIASLGENVPFKIKCPGTECTNDFVVNLNLVDLERRSMNSPEIRQRTDKIYSGKTIKWHVMTGTDEAWAEEKGKGKMGKKDKATIVLLSRIDSIDDFVFNRQKNYATAVRFLKGLSFKERSEIRKLFREHEGFLDTKVEINCSECDLEFSYELEFGEDFFYPSETLED